jgi:SAM-dependent methyltransferase
MEQPCAELGFERGQPAAYGRMFDSKFPRGHRDASGARHCKKYTRALAEMRRVLKPGGRIAIGVWDDPSKSSFVTVGGGAINRFHAATPPDPNKPGAFRFSDPDLLERVLRDAGFTDVTIASVPMPIEFESTDEYWQMFTEMAAGIKTKVLSRSCV